MKAFPEKHEFISLFECEPDVLDKDVDIPWYYNKLIFDSDFDNNKVKCVIQPSNGIMKFHWIRDGIEILNLDISWIREFKIENVGNKESLVAYFREDKGIIPLRIQFKPEMSVSWGTSVELER